jgi:hypothetical protein
MAKTPTTYPKISRKLWFLVRNKLKQSIPSVISPTLVMSLSQMKEGSARSNVINPLRELALIDENSKPTELAQRWRHDDDYKAVCHEIRDEIYPKELVEAFPDADASKNGVIKNWFMKTGQVGEAAARMYADTYILLSQADLAKSEEKPTSKASPRKSETQVRSKKLASEKKSESTEISLPPIPIVEPQSQRRLPAIHIDVQVHISPDTSPEQIDRIFESMAKHLGTHIK